VCKDKITIAALQDPTRHVTPILNLLRFQDERCAKWDRGNYSGKGPSTIDPGRRGTIVL
jgi:hypothetical protein